MNEEKDECNGKGEHQFYWCKKGLFGNEIMYGSFPELNGPQYGGHYQRCTKCGLIK